MVAVIRQLLKVCDAQCGRIVDAFYEDHNFHTTVEQVRSQLNAPVSASDTM